MTWPFVSGVLFKVRAEKAHGAHFISFDGTKTVKVTMMGFVDDSAGLIVSDATTDELGELTGKLGNVQGISVKSGLAKK